MPMLVEDDFLFTLVDPEFYEPLERYQPNEAEFIAVAARHVPATWRRERFGIWYLCTPSDATVPAEGWKIHLSATVTSAPQLLATVCPVLVDAGVPFKFALDGLIFRLLHGKGWPRGGAGKFITVYPNGRAQCVALLEALADVTQGFVGPYILSDRRYRDSRVVHYRYGGIQERRALTPEGSFTHIIEGPDGRLIDDERQPYYRLPEGVDDLLPPDEPADNAEPGTLKCGRYRIDSAITFSNAGGVYRALDIVTGRMVIIKEARARAGGGLGEPPLHAGLRAAPGNARWDLRLPRRPLCTRWADAGRAPPCKRRDGARTGGIPPVSGELRPRPGAAARDR